MITITEQILINADQQKVWNFLSDFEMSLMINQFNKKIILPNKINLRKGSAKFNIIHNFGLGDVNMIVDVIEYQPLKKIELLKAGSSHTYASFKHSIKYELEDAKSETILNYSINGSFNFKIQNIPFKPILANVVKKELKQIKNIIESLDNISDSIETKITAT